MKTKKTKAGKPSTSKYQLKIQRRAREARKLDLPPNTPYPIIWRNQNA